VSTKSERQAAREAAAANHEARLTGLIHHVGEALDHSCAGEFDVFQTSQPVHAPRSVETRRAEVAMSPLLDQVHTCAPDGIDGVVTGSSR
jgi:hypothetical protein